MNLLPFLQSHLPGVVLEAARLCLWLAILTIIFVPLERFFGAAHARRPRAELLTNLGFYFISSLVPVLLLSVPTALLGALARHVIPAAVPAAMASLPLPAKILLGLVVGEIGTYWGHRLSHEIPWLWRFHAIHHSTEHMHFLANTRTHPVDMVVTRLFGLVPLYVIGLAGASAAGSATPIAVLLIGTLWGFFIHANLRWSFGPLEWLIATPHFHHWHHSRVEHINRNYASTLPVLDRIFGTLHLPRAWPSAYGIEQPLPQTLGGQLLEPLRAPRKAAAEPAPTGSAQPQPAQPDQSQVG